MTTHTRRPYWISETDADLIACRDEIREKAATLDSDTIAVADEIDEELEARRAERAAQPMTYGGRDFDAQTLLRQIGRMNVLAISGGRVTAIRINAAGQTSYDKIGAGRAIGIRLPVSHGYQVDVLLADDDTYTVRRCFKRGARTWVKAERTGVHAEEVGEVAYRASCFRDGDTF